MIGFGEPWDMEACTWWAVTYSLFNLVLAQHNEATMKPLHMWDVFVYKHNTYRKHGYMRNIMHNIDKVWWNQTIVCEEEVEILAMPKEDNLPPLFLDHSDAS